jgi:hypothetical protein
VLLEQRAIYYHHLNGGGVERFFFSDVQFTEELLATVPFRASLQPPELETKADAMCIGLHTC